MGIANPPGASVVKSVQRGTINIATGEGVPTVNATISAVNLSKTIVLLGGVATTESSIDHRGINVRVYLQNSTTVTASAGVAGGNVYVSYEVIEYY
jgi:hypothetical protein